MDEIFRFEDFELDPGAYELRCQGRVVRLERIPLDLLFFLAERRGQLVSRQEILERVWGKDIALDVDTSINTAVRKIRRAVGDNPENPRFLKTVSGKGYRFVVPITESKPSQPPLSESLSCPTLLRPSCRGSGAARFGWDWPPRWSCWSWLPHRLAYSDPPGRPRLGSCLWCYLSITSVAIPDKSTSLMG